MNRLLSLSSLGLLLILSNPTLAKNAGERGAPPECETDEECIQFGYESCDIPNGTCEDGEPYPDCESTGCPDGEICLPGGTCSPGLVETDATTADGDASSADAATDTATEIDNDVDATSSSSSGGGGGGCQTGDSPRGWIVWALACMALFVTRRRWAHRHRFPAR